MKRIPLIKWVIKRGGAGGIDWVRDFTVEMKSVSCRGVGGKDRRVSE